MTAHAITIDAVKAGAGLDTAAFKAELLTRWAVLSTGTVPKGTYTATTDSSGDATLTIDVPDDGTAWNYRLTGSDGVYGDLLISSASPTTWRGLVALINVKGDKLEQSALDKVGAGYLPTSGGTLTGHLVLSGDPIADLHPATKRWIEQNFLQLE